MPDSAYPPARTAAAIVSDFFARRIRPAGYRPDPATVAAVVNAAFWASLRREEGYEPKISLAYLPPEADAQPLVSMV